MVTCSACGSKNAPEAKFCSECGARLASASRPIEERKVVTIVFCDLVGSTARAEQLDPEDVRAELSSYHARVRSELERHGGTVEKFIGDAVVAVFGAPLVHEDDAERAVRSALAIRDWALEEDAVDVRLAVNTGEALVSIDARADAGEGLVAGDVINTAARLQTAAPVNGILVGEKTYRATEGPIEYRERGSVAAKGKQEPICVWEAVSARSLFGVDVDLKPSTRLVGRRRELDLLVDALGRARAEREPQLVTIVGVPGMGKSRLVQELSAWIEAEPELIRWRQGRSLPYGEGVSYWGLGEMVKAEAGILESDAAPVAESKLRETVARVCGEQRGRVVASDVAATRRYRRRRLQRGPARRGVRGLASVPGGPCRGARDCARLRGSPLGGRRLARLRRFPGRLGDGRAAPCRRHGASRAPRAPSALGRRQDECRDVVAGAAVRSGDD